MLADPKQSSSNRKDNKGEYYHLNSPLRITYVLANYIADNVHNPTTSCFGFTLLTPLPFPLILRFRFRYRLPPQV
jgi:hypothetical protein